MNEFEAPKYPPERGPLSWPGRVWDQVLNYGEWAGNAGKVRLALWVIALLAIVAFGVWGYIAMR